MGLTITLHSMIKLIIFDLDGVVVDTEQIHYRALISACADITGLDSKLISKFIAADGTSTSTKLTSMATSLQLLPETIAAIDNLKQTLVIKEFSSMVPNSVLTELLLRLKADGYIIAIGSNSRKLNVDYILSRLEVSNLFNVVVSGSDVTLQKPAPDIFCKIMHLTGMAANDTLILEDSPAGIAAAISAGAHFLKINTCADTTISNIQNAIIKADCSSPDGGARVKICGRGLH